MGAFDLIVRLFGLLLGLAMGEVLAGFARTLRLRLGVSAVADARVRIGWLVPLLGLVVLLSQLSFWLAFYELHGDVPLNLLVLLGLLGVVGGFYLVSALVFPAAPENWPDFDAYYLHVRRTVIGGVLAIELAALAYGSWLMQRGGATGDNDRHAESGRLGRIVPAAADAGRAAGRPGPASQPHPFVCRRCDSGDRGGDAVQIRLPQPLGPIMSSGRTILSKVSPSTKPSAMASSRSVVPFLCAVLATLVALS